jgi:hypothetical protein
LKRWKRSRGFLQFSLDTAIYTVITDFFQGLNRKSFKSGSNGGGGYCSSDSRRFRAREVTGSGAKERGRRGDSVPYLTYPGDAS